MKMEFKDLKIGDEFDWIGGEYPSFFLRCVKVGDRYYRDTHNVDHKVGSIRAKVFHAETPPKIIASFFPSGAPIYNNTLSIPCYDCGSIFSRRHTPNCNMALPGDDTDLPHLKMSQHWGVSS
jgi:hypothetical protein